MSDLMKELIEKIPYWPIATVVLVVFVCGFFRKELAALIGKLQRFEVEPRNRKFKLIFNEQIQHARARAQVVGKEVAGRPTLPVGERTADFARESARDLVLQSWGALKQVIYDGCVASEIALTPTTGVRDAMHRLAQAKGIRPELETLMSSLDKLGAELANHHRLRPAAVDARQYREIANDFIDWMMLNVIARAPEKGEPVVQQAADRRTAVGEFFVPPQAGRPAATLQGTSGGMRGKQFAVEKDYFRMGRDSDNDLRISEDEFVSGHHAALQYRAGSLFLTDEGSRNGTFLNDNRVTRGAVIVRSGDSIRLGNTAFRVGVPVNLSGDRDKARKQQEIAG